MDGTKYFLAIMNSSSLWDYDVISVSIVEQTFRCFAYQKLHGPVSYLLSQSGDATCHGVSATEGSRTMKLMNPMWIDSKKYF